MKAIKYMIIAVISVSFFGCSRSTTDCLTYKGTSAYQSGGKINHNYKNRKTAAPARKPASF